MRGVAGLLLLSVSLVSFAADFPPIEKAMPMTVAWGDSRLVVAWAIQPGYAIYRNGLSLSGRMGAVATVGTPREIESADPSYREIFTGSLRMVADLYPRKPDETVLVEWQGCSLAGYCYPPQRTLLKRP